MTEENTRKDDDTKQAENVVREFDQAFRFFGLVISAKYTCSNYCTGTSLFFFLIYKTIIEENK